MNQIDYLIIGGGLAGLTFAQIASQRGRQVQVVDRGDPGSSSRVAAGIIHPITGRRFNKSWRFDQLWSSASQHYRSLEELTGQSFFYERPMLRILRDADQQLLWADRKERPDLTELCREATARELPTGLQAEWGALWVNCAAQLDVARYLDVLETRLPVRCVTYDHDELAKADDGFIWRDVKARKLVFCQGHETSTHPLFAAAQIRPAGGEILRLKIENYQDDAILNRGKWLLRDDDGSFRAGSTYEWHQLDAGATEAGREEILQGVRELLPHSKATVVEHFSGIRPMANQGRPVVGTHPSDGRIGFLNGLGAKGALLAPHFAQRLLEHMETGAPLDPKVDLHGILARN